MIPQVHAGLQAYRFPRNPSNVFCLGEYPVENTSLQGYYLGNHGAIDSEFILLVDGRLVFDRKFVTNMTAIAISEKFTEHDMLDVIDKLMRMLELAPTPAERSKSKKRSWIRRSQEALVLV